MTGYLIQGLILGFSIAAPVGPIGVLCIRRTLDGGMLRGFVSGLGTACADALYGIMAAGGLTAVSAFLIDQQSVLRLVGGLFLCYLGWTAWRTNPVADETKVPAAGKLWTAYASAFFLTITNPMTILSFIAVFAGLGIGSAARDYEAAATLVLGVFVGSAAWWLLLSGAASMLRGRLNSTGLIYINRISGIIITGFGVVCVLSPLI